jgi:hypothetical protein
MDSATINIDSIIKKLLKAKDETIQKPVDLLESEVIYLCSEAKKSFLSSPMLQELNAPLKIAGMIQFSYE